MSIKVRTVERKGRTFLEQLYLVEVIKGMKVTLGHLLRNLLDTSKLYVRHYPEVQPEISPRWRGRHRLTKHEDGTVKCVPCGKEHKAPCECARPHLCCIWEDHGRVHPSH